MSLTVTVMRKFILVCLIIFGAGYLVKDYVASGRFERYMDAHPNARINPAVDYYWAMLASLANRSVSAKYHAGRVLKLYPDTPYAPKAWAEYINVLYDEDNKNKVLEEGEKFLEKYPNHPRAAIIRKKILFLQHGY